MSSCSWLSSCTAPVKGPSRSAKTPWQRRTDRARGLLRCQLPTCSCSLAAGFRPAQLRSKDTFAAPKNGSGPRPAAAQTAKHIQTSQKLAPNLDFACSSALPTANLLVSSCSWLSSCAAPVKGPPRSAKTKDGSGPRPAAQTAKRHLLKWLETSSKPWLCLLFCTANCQLARVLLQLSSCAAPVKGPSQRQNTMAVKDGSGPRPAAQTAKRHLLKRLETSSKPWLCLPFCTANCQLARVLLQLAFVLHGSGARTVLQGQNTMAVKDGSGTANLLGSSCSWFSFCTAPVKGPFSQRQNTMAVKDGSGPRPAAQTAKRHLLKWLENLADFACPSALPNCQLARVAFVLHSSGQKTPWQWRTDQARGRQPRLPNVTFWKLARVLLQLAFVLHSSGQRTLSQRQNTMAVKDGSGPRPAAQTAKRHLLKWLETSSKPWLCLLSCTANCQLARVLLQLAFVLHSSGQRTLSQRAFVWHSSGLSSSLKRPLLSAGVGRYINPKSGQQALSTGKAPGPSGPYL